MINMRTFPWIFIFLLFYTVRGAESLISNTTSGIVTDEEFLHEAVEADDTTSRHFGNDHMTQDLPTGTTMLTNTTTEDITGLTTTSNIIDTTYMQNLFDNDPCKFFGTCDYTRTLQFPYCHCEKQCEDFNNNCCFEPQNLTHHISINQYIYECLDFDSIKSSRHGYYVITKCFHDLTNDSNGQLVEKCQGTNIVSVGPWVLGDNGLIYRNKFCAQCNGIASFKLFSVQFNNVPVTVFYEIWNKTKEEKITLLSNDDMYRYMYYKLVPPFELDNVMECYDVHPINNASLECQNYIVNPVFSPYDAKVFYRNAYCFPDEIKDMLCLGPFISRSVINNLYDMYPLTILFNFERQDSVDDCDMKIDDICTRDELYQYLTVEKLFSIKSTGNISDSLIKQVIFTFAWSLVDYPNVTQLENIIAVNINNATIPTVVVQYVLLKYVILRNGYSQNVMYFAKKIENAFLMMKIMLNRSATLQIYTAKSIFSKLVEYEYMYHYFLKLVPIKDFKSTMTEMFIENSVEVENPFCDSIFIDCNYDDEASGIERYLRINEVLCKNDLADDDYLGYQLDVDSSSTVATFVTYIGVCLSIFSLVVSIIVHKKIGLTRSVPGTNVENVSIALILSHILFVTGIGANDYQVVCLVVGILLHYTWLTVFAFMTITNVYMAKNIRSMVIANTGVIEDTIRRKRKLTAAGLFLPLIAVVPSCVVEYMDITPYAPEYKGKVCFPTSYPANLLFVSGPILTCIAINAISLVMVISFIYRHTNETKHIQKSQSYQQINVYIRMSTLTGVFWVTGIIGAAFESEAVNYIFIVICSLQGFMIALCNLTTSNVIRDMKKLLTPTD